jgi:hypothetical protein
MRLPGTMHCGTVVPKVGSGAQFMNFSDSSDECLLHYYESVRRQVIADSQSGRRYRLVGANVREYADRLKDEIDRRRLEFRPIDWPSL